MPLLKFYYYIRPPRAIVVVLLLPVRDHSDDDIEHDEWAEEDEGDEVEVRDGWPAATLRVRDIQLTILNTQHNI